MELVSLFPTTIGISSIPLNDVELILKLSNSGGRVQNIGNETSTDTYILGRPELRGVRIRIEEEIQKYMREVYDPQDPLLEVYITQSWVNYTEGKGHHHEHNHPNSVISGVLYLEASCQDNVSFMRPKDPLPVISVLPNNVTPMNAGTWMYEGLSAGVLVMFPSSLPHKVEEVVEGTRVSLAFNTFVRGSIGSRSGLTELVLT